MPQAAQFRIFRPVAVMRFLAAAATASWLAGCASPMADTKKAETDQSVLEPANLPGETLAQRMDRLERDLAAMRIAQSRIEPAMAEVLDRLGLPRADAFGLIVPTGPQISAQVQNSPPPMPVRAAPVTNPRSSQPAVGGSGYGVHVASFRDPALVRDAWARITRDYPVLLGGLTPVVAKVDLGERGIFYRLKAGPLDQWGDAATVCQALEANDWHCAVLDFEGTPLDGESATRDHGT